MLSAQEALNLCRKNKEWKGIFDKEKNEKSEQKEIRKEKKNRRFTVA